MSVIPMIQPSRMAVTSASSTKRSIFSEPSVNLRSRDKDLVNMEPTLDENLKQDYISTMYLHPSPIAKGTTAESWTRNNRTIRSAFRPSTNEIAVFVAGKKAAEEFPVKQQATNLDNTIFLCQPSIPKSRIPFITEMFDVFSNATNKNPYTAAFIYRENYDLYLKGIKKYYGQLHESVRNNMETDDTQSISKELQIIKDVHAIWQLTEYMFLTSDDEKPLALLLSKWLEIHEFDALVDRAKDLSKQRSKIKDPDFWPYVNRCILRGMRNNVLYIVDEALREEESDEVADALAELLRLLRGIPSLETMIRDSNLNQRHFKWQQECKKFAKSPALKHLGNEAATTIKILLGDLDAIFEQTDSWKDAMAAIILYTDPDRPRQEIGPTLDLCVSKYLTGKEITLVDRIKIAIFQMDAIKAVRYCSSFDDPWLVAHLTDVLHQHGFLDPVGLTLQDLTSSGLETNIRDFFIISYAQSLISDPDLWEVIAGYLLRCGRTGRTMLSTWICHVPLDSPEKAIKVLEFCKNNNLLDSLQSINRVIGVEQEKLGRYDMAIQHFIASKDNDRVAKVVDNLMRKLLKEGTLDLDESLGSLTGQKVHNEHVEFLRLYGKFQRYRKSDKVVLAGRQLVDLLSLEKAPKKYWALLLFDALPLLESKKLIFSSADTYELMRCLEEVVGSPHMSEYLQLLPPTIATDSVSTEDRVLLLDVIRLSLAKNLARALVHEPFTGSLL
ncbi:MAG: Nup85 nucleoporin-domain-containing protein [Podila humilis]|nr:MAG: Nup85 nucleoporin-domain-containing protein [Podila humilis]